MTALLKPQRNIAIAGPRRRLWAARCYCAWAERVVSTYRLKSRGAVVAALGTLVGIAAGGNVRVVGLLAVGHGCNNR